MTLEQTDGAVQAFDENGEGLVLRSRQVKLDIVGPRRFAQLSSQNGGDSSTPAVSGGKPG